MDPRHDGRKAEGDTWPPRDLTAANTTPGIGSADHGNSLHPAIPSMEKFENIFRDWVLEDDECGLTLEEAENIIRNGGLEEYLLRVIESFDEEDNDYHPPSSESETVSPVENGELVSGDDGALSPTQPPAAPDYSTPVPAIPASIRSPGDPVYDDPNEQPANSGWGSEPASSPRSLPIPFWCRQPSLEHEVPDTPLAEHFTLPSSDHPWAPPARALTQSLPPTPRNLTYREGQEIIFATPADRRRRSLTSDAELRHFRREPTYPPATRPSGPSYHDLWPGGGALSYEVVRKIVDAQGRERASRRRSSDIVLRDATVEPTTYHYPPGPPPEAPFRCIWPNAAVVRGHDTRLGSLGTVPQDLAALRLDDRRGLGSLGSLPDAVPFQWGEWGSAAREARQPSAMSLDNDNASCGVHPGGYYAWEMEGCREEEPEAFDYVRQDRRPSWVVRQGQAIAVYQERRFYSEWDLFTYTDDGAWILDDSVSVC